MKGILDLPRKKEMALGIYISEMGIAAAEIAAYCGFHFLQIDHEHTIRCDTDMASLIRVATNADIPTIIRVASLEEASRLLNFGATGIMYPGVETAEQAAAVVKCCKFAPLGERGMMRTSRVFEYGLAPFEKYFPTANDVVTVCLQIESKKGLENIDQILAVEGVDMINVGKWDLSQSLGVAGKPDAPQVLEAEEYVIQKTLERGKHPFMSGVSTPEQVAKLKSRGIYCAAICADVPFFARALKTHIAKFVTN